MIDQSLKDKILANEQKVKSLFKLNTSITTVTKKIYNKKNPQRKKSDISLKPKKKEKIKNISQEKISSFRENKENQKNLINLELSPITKIKSNNNINTNTISNKNFDAYIKPSVKKIPVKEKCKPNIKIKSKELECFINVKKSNNKNYCKTNNTNKNINNNIYNNNATIGNINVSERIKKVKNKIKNISKSIIIETNNNSISNSKQFLSEKNLVDNLETNSIGMSSLRLHKCTHKKNKKSLDFNLTYGRFIENEFKKNERIFKIKKSREKFEKKIYPHQPKINNKSKSITKSITDNFLTRLEKYQKEQIEREETLKRSILKDEFERINKNNFLMIQKRLKKKKVNDCASVDKTYNNKTITESINKLLDWEKRRKEKIENEIKKQDLIEKNSHFPKINKNKSKIFSNQKELIKKIFYKLYNNKVMIGFKKEVNEESPSSSSSTPKFKSKPKLSKTKSQPNIYYNIRKIISFPNEKNKNKKKEENKKDDINKNEKEKEDINQNIKKDIDDIDELNNMRDTNDELNIKNIDINNEIKKLNNTDRIIFETNNKIDKVEENENENIIDDQETKIKNPIVVIRKIKSQVDNSS